MLLYIMLYIMLAYLMLFVCIMFFLALNCENVFFVFLLCLGLLTHILFIYCIIMLSSFNQLVFPNSMFTPFLLLIGLCDLWRNST